MDSGASGGVSSSCSTIHGTCKTLVLWLLLLLWFNLNYLVIWHCWLPSHNGTFIFSLYCMLAKHKVGYTWNFILSFQTNGFHSCIWNVVSLLILTPFQENFNIDNDVFYSWIKCTIVYHAMSKGPKQLSEFKYTQLTEFEHKQGSVQSFPIMSSVTSANNCYRLLNMNHVPGHCYLYTSWIKKKIICITLLYRKYNDC